MERPWLVAVMGPTGSGKSWLAERLAERLGGQLINADAFQVYRGFDIGTNKPADRSRYQLIDIKEPWQDFGVGEWARLAQSVLERLWAQRRHAVVVGGTGLYIRALFEEYQDMGAAPDPDLRRELEQRERSEGLGSLVKELRERAPGHSVDEANPVRVRRALERLQTPAPPVNVRLPNFRKAKFALEPDRLAHEAALAGRVSRMFADGWAEEVRELLANGVETGCPAMRAIGYECVVKCLRGELDQGAAEKEVLIATRRYAKRQRTWLRSEPRLIGLPLAALDEEGLHLALDSVIRRLKEEKE